MTAIITSAETRQSLCAVRALGRAKVPVAVCAKKRPALAMWSRFASSTFLTEDEKDPKSFVEDLVDELRARYASVILTSRDSTWWALSHFRDLLPQSAQRILPPHYSVVRSLNHEALYHFAESLGIACVKLLPIGPDAIEAKNFPFSYPVRIRPRIALNEGDDLAPHNPRLVASSLPALLSLIDSHAWLKNGFLVSDYEAVRAISYFGVAEKGQVLVEGFQERLNEAAPLNEVSTLTETIEPIVAIKRSAVKLLSALQWQGPFKVDFIKDSGKSYRLVSLIGRLWGSLELSVKAGVNIPLITYQQSLGEISESLLQNARPRVRLRWLLGDVMSKVAHPRHMLMQAKESVQNFSPKSLFNWNKRVTEYYDVLDLDDPMPFLFEIQNKTWKRAMGAHSE